MMRDEMDVTEGEVLALSGNSDEEPDNGMSSHSYEFETAGSAVIEDPLAGVVEEAMNSTQTQSLETEVESLGMAQSAAVAAAAAAAAAAAKKRKRPHSFETNPSIRKRHRNRLLRKLRKTIDEFATRGGQQAVVLVTIPGKPETSFKCFGAKPLEDVVKKLRLMIMDDLEAALTQHAPPPPQDDPSLFELPALTIDGIPTPVEKMTQAQLRAFIPLMLKYSTGRGKPGWGRESTKPPWWPHELPWANIRIDARTEEEKQRISWTHALRQIVINCYKYHGREDLLPSIPEDDEEKICMQAGTATNTVNNESVLKFHTSQKQSPAPSDSPIQTAQLVTEQYAPTVLQTISNPDGTVSIIQVDPNNPFITLPDGTTAQVQGLATIHTSNEDGTHTLQALAENSQGETVVVDLNSVGDGSDGQQHQLILTDENGRSHSVSVSGTISLPLPASMYQTVMANLQQIHTQEDGTTIQVVAPMIHVPKLESNDPSESDDQSATTHQIVVSTGPGSEPQVLQVLSIKDDSTDDGKS